MPPPSVSGSGRSWNPTEHYKDVRVAERYDATRFSSLAGRVFNAIEKWCVRRAFTRVAVGSVVVDVPCGTGRLAEVLLDRGYHVTGVDISPAMLRVAERKLARYGARFRTRLCDARELHALHEVFDAALCARVLMHFPLDEQIRFLRGIADVTSGPVVFTQSYSTGYQRLRRRLKRRMGHAEPVAHPLTEQQLRLLLAGAGLREARRLRVMPLVSEAMVVVAEKVPPDSGSRV